MIRKCKHYQVEFMKPNGRVFSNHVRRCDKNPARNNNSLSESKKKIDESRLGKILYFNLECNQCHKNFQVQEREKQHPVNDEYYCSKSCANTRCHSDA